MIFSGSVSVVLKENTIPNKDFNYNLSSNSSFNGLDLTSTPERIQSNPYKKKRDAAISLVKKKNLAVEERNTQKATIAEMGIKIKESSKGEMFGIHALLSRTGKRSASIFTNVNCELIVLLKRDYLQILTTFNKERREKFKFISEQIPCIAENTSSKVFEDYFYLFKNENYLKNDILTKEGTQGNKIYFIAEGFCVITKIVKPDTSKRSQKMISTLNLAIGKAGPGTIVGEELVFEKSENYKYTVTVFHFNLNIKLINVG